MQRTLTLAFACLLAAGAGFSQTAGGAGTVRGIVRDGYGDGLPDARVMLLNDETGLVRTLETTLDGVFHVPSVPPGQGYRLKVTRSEYESWQSEAFPVPTGKAVVFEIFLPEAGGNNPPGSSASGRILEAPEDGPSTVLTRRRIEQLPLSTPRFQDLLLLTPTASAAGQSEPAFLGQATPVPVYVDGVSTLNTSSNLSLGLTARGTADSIEGIEVLTQVFPVAYGGTYTGVVQMATRSGANAFHGGAYEYYRGSGMTAASRFALGRRLSEQQHQFGASLGGPLMKNRLQFFANYEGRDSKGFVFNRLTTPLLAESGGGDIALSNCKASTAQCTAAAQYLRPQMNILASSPSHSAAGVLRLDFRPSQGHAFLFVARDGHYHWPNGFRSESVALNGGALWQGDFSARTRSYKAGWTAALGAGATNEFAWGSLRDRLVNWGPATQAPLGALSIRIGEASAGASEPYQASRRQFHRNQIGNHLRGSIWTHTVEAGIQWSESPHWISELHEAAGAYQYPSLTEFALDFSGGTARNYNSFRQTLGNPDRKFRIREFAVYLQDTWQALRRLTVEGGLRWDRAGLPKPLAADGYFYQTGKIPAPNLAFSPRVGAAYRLDDSTVARFGFGIFYAPFASTFVDALFLGNGRYQTNLLVTGSQTGAPLFPNVIASATAAPFGSKNITYAPSTLRYPYNAQVSLSLERRLDARTSVAARYINSSGKRLLTVKDVNLNTPSVTKSYSVLDSAGAVARSYSTQVWTAKTSSGYGHVYELGNGGSSSYNALVLELRTRPVRAFSAEAFYTWSHSISNVNGPWAIPAVSLSSISGNPEADKGSANADQRHRAVFVWNWEPTLPAGAPAPVRTLLNGWQHSAVVTLGSALPSTPTVFLGGQQFAGTTMLYTDSLNGSGGWARVPFLPVNSLRGEAQYSLNARITRTISFAEKAQGKLSVEVFNLFDSQPVIRVQSAAYYGSGGTLRPVAGANAAAVGGAPRSAQLAFRVEF